MVGSKALQKFCESSLGSAFLTMGYAELGLYRLKMFPWLGCKVAKTFDIGRSFISWNRSFPCFSI